ncbi:MAG TPA: hypothetical protein VF914_02045 [Chloroflexia bacterium]|jgi:hypothetical protein
MFAYGRHTGTWRSRSFHVAIPLNPFRPRRWLSVELVRIVADKNRAEASTEANLKIAGLQQRPLETRQLLEEHILRQVTRRYM